MFSRHLLLAAMVLASASAPLTGHATTLLLDNFSTGSFATSSGPGGGFGLGGGAGNTNAFESGGLAYVGAGGGSDENIYSLKTFNPDNTTLTWNVNSSPTIGAAGVMIGFAQSGIYTCAGCGPEIWLEARDDRLVFDVNGNNGFYRYVDLGAGSTGPNTTYPGETGPLTMELALTATTWQFDVTGSGTNVDLSGTFVPGFGPDNVVAAAGGPLSIYASVRSDCPGCGDYGTFSQAELTVAPEPSSLLLLGFGLAGVASALGWRGKRR